jgi:hypothetical protein
MDITKNLLTKIGKFLFNLLFEKKINKETSYFQKPKRKVNKVFIHCSDSDSIYYGLEEIKKDHVKNNKWDDIGYHYVITREGEIQKGRSLECIPSAQKGHNTNSIAICVCGKRIFTDDSLLALVELCEEIHNSYKRITFHGHCEVSNKTCPNFDYGGWLNLFDNGVMDIV